MSLPKPEKAEIGQKWRWNGFAPDFISYECEIVEIYSHPHSFNDVRILLTKVFKTQNPPFDLQTGEQIVVANPVKQSYWDFLGPREESTPLDKNQSSGATCTKCHYFNEYANSFDNYVCFNCR